MLIDRNLRAALAVGASLGSLLAAAPALAADATATADTSGTTIGELVVTAERREESIQSTPLAVSAFSADSLKAKRLDTGSDLLLAVPNVTFSRGNFGGYNFQIRGIGTKLVATSGDAAIGIHENNIPLTSNTLADAEFYDVQRVEVLRGPQGTQFGRNTTGGLVNVLTNQPTDQLSAAATAEYGNYNTIRGNGFVNLPITDTLALRLAGSYIRRDGFGFNNITGTDTDNRDLYSTRVTLQFKPSDRFKVALMWEHFNEDDNRDRVGKQLCVTDNGPTSIGGVATNLPGRETQNSFSQGCLQADLHGPSALGEVNSAATLGGGLGVLTGLITGNAYAGKVQDPDLRHIESAFNPIYKNRMDLVTLQATWEVADNLTLTSATSWSKSAYFTEADYNRATPTNPFNANVPDFCAVFGCPSQLVTDSHGNFVDPQVGTGNLFRTIDFSSSDSKQWTQEFRLQSSFDGPVNFSLGGSYLKFNTAGDYYVTSNTLTAAVVALFNPTSGCPPRGSLSLPQCFYVDPSTIPDGSGHNYFDSRSQYQLTSYAAFGELIWRLSDDFKVTGGLRYTDDNKQVLAFSPPLFTPGFGQGVAIAGLQEVTFHELTGRLNADWTPDLSFTDQSLFYASYSRGYKGGGFNPPQSPGQHSFPDTFAPEFIDAFEVGTKNTLAGGALVLNGTAFYYNYKGYQVSEIIQRTSVNVNINAKIYGAEFEGIWAPVENLQLNATIGYLHSRLGDSESIDLSNLTQSNPAWQVVKNGANYSDCIAPVAQLAALQARVNAGAVPAGAVSGNPLSGGGVCAGQFLPGTPGALAAGVSVTPLMDTAGNVLPGFAANLNGNRLPNSPSWTVALGAQYRWKLESGWDITPRVDFYYQASSFARIFNAVNDTLDAYTNVNATLLIDKPDLGWSFQFYVKNLFDKTVVTDQYLTDDTSGLFTNIFLTEPRTYGVSVTKRF